ncbi:MAG: hypothetical protein LAT52_04075 [Balneolales bacterium]|nr:hypothetical protein [Balneolales bacterium]
MKLSDVNIAIQLLAAIVVLLSTTAVHATEPVKGNFLVTNYSPSEYAAGTQNWEMVQDDAGRIYIANRDGVLVFDGINWNLIELPISTPLRSLAIDSRNRVYIGGVGQFGYLQPDSAGVLKFVSLSDQFEEVISDVWETHLTDDGVVFATRSSLFRCLAHDCEQITPGYQMARSFSINGSLLVSVPGRGIAQLRGSALEIVIPEDVYHGGLVFKLIESDEFITDDIRLGQGLYLFKRNGDIYYYEYTTSRMYVSDEFLPTSARIPPETYRINRLRNGDLAFATISSGIHVLDYQMQARYHINRQSGLRVDMALNVFEDRDGSLWALLNNGISRIDKPDYVRYWNEDSGIVGTVLHIGKFGNSLAVSTSSGVFIVDYDNANITPERINPVASQMWQSKEISVAGRTYLLVAGNNQLFYWDGQEHRLLKETAARSLYQSRTKPGRIFIGYLQGWGYIDLVPDASGNLRIQNDVVFTDPPFEIRGIFEDEQGSIWMQARFHGIFKANVTADLNSDPDIQEFTYDWADVSSETIVMDMHMLADSVVFAGPTGMLKLNHEEKRFTSGNPLYDDVLRDRIIMDVAIIDADQILVLMHQGYAILRRAADGIWEIQSESGRDVPDAPMYGLALTEEYIWTGGAEGLFRYNRSHRPNHFTDFNAVITSVVLGQDSLIYGGHHADEFLLQLAYDRSQISINFGAARFSRFRNLYFESKLEGFDQTWTPLTTESRRIYTNLPDGSYRFRVRATDLYGITSQEDYLLIQVATPWFKSWWAYLMYTFIMAGTIFGLVKLRTQAVERKNKQLELIVSKRTASLQVEKRRLEIINEDLRTHDEHREKFLSVVAHDLRNPLMIIKSSAELVEEEGMSREEMLELTGFIRDAADRMQKIIEVLLEDRAKKIRSFVDEGSRVNISGLIDQLVKEFTQWSERKAISIDTSGVPEDLYMHSDAAVAGVIVSNLMSNAIKYSNRGKTIWVKAAAEPGCMVVTVEDEGLGMTANDLKEVGKPFKKLSARPTDGEPSSGLGLHIVKDLITALGGSMNVYSDGPGKGTRFVVTFPVDTSV